MSRFVLIAILVGAAPRGAHAQERELRLIADDIAAVGMKLETLVADYRNPEILGGTKRISERFTNAEILFLLADYQRASILLFDLVEDSRLKRGRGYGKVLYYLAESQFQMGNDMAARDYFQKLVERREADQLPLAIRRLIEIADRSERWEGLDEHVGVLRKRGRLPASIAYIHAKSLLRQGKHKAVKAATAGIPSNSRVYPKARYLTAVSALQLGKLDAARRIFEELTKIGDGFEDAERLRDLAAMNRGRILFEQGKLSASIDAYQFIARSSPLFDEALYEITWLFVRAASMAQGSEDRKKEYAKALKSLEILLLSARDGTIASEARLLFGNILLRLDRYEEATEAFHEVVERYRPVRDEIIKLTDQVEDPIAYYEEIVQRSRGGGGLLPPLAVKWASGEKELQKALGVVTDIDQSEVWIDESIQIIDKLLALLGSEKRAQFFPGLQEAQARELELENTLIALSHRLLAVERVVVEAELDPARAAALKDLIEERARLEPEYRALPQTREDYEDRLVSMRQKMQALQKKAYRLRWEIEEMRRGITGLNQWLAENPGIMPDNEEADIRARISLADKEVSELERMQRDLEHLVKKERNFISVTTEEQARDEEVRARYAATLDREREILSVGSAAVVGNRRALLGQVERHRKSLERFHAEIASFKGHLADVVAERSLDIKGQLLQEQGVLAAQAEAIQEAREEAKRVVGDIAVASLKAVERTFRDIVLRGDVGIVDVAWALKEEQTHEISRRVNEQRKELQVMDSEFNEVLVED